MTATDGLRLLLVEDNPGDAVIFREKCIDGLEADRERCAALVEHSLAMATALAPRIGYDAAAKIAKQSFETGRPVREIAREQQVLPDAELEHALDPRRQTDPGV